MLSCLTMILGAWLIVGLVQYLFDHGVLVTGLAYPVVPRGDEEIRSQVNADHTEADVDHVLGLLEAYQS